MKRNFIYKLIPLVLAGIFMLAGCAEVAEDVPVVTEQVTEPEKQPYPVTIGSLVFNSSPETAASLSPAITEIIAELGFESKLTGRSSYCTYPESIASCADLGSSANPDVDAVIANAPQLLVSQSPIAKKDITAIEAAGTRVLIISTPSSVEELYGLYGNLYKVFKGETEDETAVISGKFTKLEEVFAKYENMLGSYAYILSHDLAAASDSTFAGDFFSHFGSNCAADSEDNTITAEKLLEADPDWLILSAYMSIDDLPEELGELSAVKNKRIIVLDETAAGFLERPTSRVYLVAEYVSHYMNAVLDETSAEETEENSD
ncbi:MAG: ABC transporter substrate-binding protein [Oscillospiraceae bacterium]|nr:ABC transporter substrate-binding protein [Oscillospiraceae bacterium]